MHGTEYRTFITGLCDIPCSLKEKPDGTTKLIFEASEVFTG